MGVARKTERVRFLIWVEIICFRFDGMLFIYNDVDRGENRSDLDS